MYIYVGMREYSGGEGSLPLHALDDPQCAGIIGIHTYRY